MSETRDTELFARLNEQRGWFTEWQRTPRYGEYDVTAVDTKGRQCVIELKYRDLPSDAYDSYIIESDKLTDGLLYHLRGIKPLYINFFNDGKVLVWDLSNPDNKPVKQKGRRENPGHGRQDSSCYYLLPAQTARVSTLCPPDRRPAGKGEV